MKVKKITIILICIAMFVCLLCGCSPKEVIDAETFTKTMESKSFTVTNVTNDTETNNLAKSVIIASNESYQIEFFILTDNDTGENVFYNGKQLFDDEHSVKTLSSEVNLDNYNYYAFNADGNFHIIARIDNTMLYCEAAKEHRSEIVDLIKTLGYK